MLKNVLPDWIRQTPPYECLRNVKRRVMGRSIPGSVAGCPGRPGFFAAEDGGTVHIETPHPPHNLTNLLYNRRYYTLIDHRAGGQGRHMTPEGHVNNLVENERHLYVRDRRTRRYFSVAWQPVGRPYVRWECASGPGWQRWINRTDGLEVVWCVWVPAGEDPVEIWDITVRNLTRRSRRVDLFTWVMMNCEGEELYHGQLCRIARFDPQLGAVFVRMDTERHEQINHPFHNGFMTSHPAPLGGDCNPGEFLGPGGRTMANPQVVERGCCAGSAQPVWPAAAILQIDLDLPPGSERVARVIVGACDLEPMIRRLRQRYHPEGDAWAATRRAWADLTANVAVESPEPGLDLVLNRWVQIQCNYGLRWGRWGWCGYRDILQQAIGNLTVESGLSRERILEACRHQFHDGFALRGWRPVNRMRYADSAFWLVPAVTEYVKETGDFGLLDEVVPFFDEGEASVYVHLIRALGRLYEDRGDRGLCLSFDGDWNDSLTGICRQGRGQSVWLSMALVYAAGLMTELAHRLDRAEDEALFEQRASEVGEAIHQQGWDGQWYLCAWNDAGHPVGSNKNAEGRIYLNMQSWAALSGVADDPCWQAAWRSVRRHLDTGWGLMLNWPAYRRPDYSVGRITYIQPGTQENASVYTHGNAFMLMALLARRQPDEALELWRAIAPGNPRRPAACMPHVFYNGYLGPDSEILPGLADHPWTTGSGAWMYHAALEMMIGLRRTYDGLHIRPCLPSAWSRVRVHRIYRATRYDVTIHNPAGLSAAPVKSITINGRRHPPEDALPADGREHTVMVELEDDIPNGRLSEA